MLVVGLVLVAAVGIGVYRARSVDVADSYEDIREQFKYGSIGSDSINGIPYWIWLVLPTVSPEYLPDRPGDGYARMGFLYEPESPAHQRPIGISYRNYQSIPRIGVNCGACHTGVYRESVDSPGTIVLGMPAEQMDLQSFFVFLFKAARDPRFEPDVLLPAIHALTPSFSWFEDLVYRFLVIPTTRDALRKRADQLSFAERLPREGPGRVDTFTSYKVHFGLPIEDVVGTADLPPLWNQRPRRGMALHWDGNNDRVEERNISAAMGAGATEESLDLLSLARMAEWVLDLPPPVLARERIAAARLGTGEQVFQSQCADCHAFNGSRVGTVMPIGEIGTDPERWRSFSPDLAEKMLTFKGYGWQFSHFRKTDGYVNMPLDGIWLRAPYLHNGSVPTLRDLLRPPAERPTVFYRGYDLYDFDNLGFVSAGPEAERVGFRFDTRERGNSNQGHGYGTTLTATEIDDLLEFLKAQ